MLAVSLTSDMGLFPAEAAVRKATLTSVASTGCEKSLTLENAMLANWWG